MTLDEYCELMRKEEQERREHPCCANCRYFYTEYGYDGCTFWDEPKDDVNNDKCSEWN